MMDIFMFKNCMISNSYLYLAALLTEWRYPLSPLFLSFHLSGDSPFTMEEVMGHISNFYKLKIISLWNKTSTSLIFLLSKKYIVSHLGIRDLFSVSWLELPCGHQKTCYTIKLQVNSPYWLVHLLYCRRLLNMNLLGTLSPELGRLSHMTIL